MIFEFEFDYSSYGKDLGEFYFEFGKHCLFLQAREDSMPGGEMYDIIIFEGFPENKKVRITEKFFNTMKHYPVRDCIAHSSELDIKKYRVTSIEDGGGHYKLVAENDHPNWDDKNYKSYTITVIDAVIEEN